VSAFSSRARPDAGVSTPLHWDELGDEDVRGRFTVLTVPKRLATLKEDPWAGYAAAQQQSISAAMRRSLAGRPSG
jgi:bifunctional non-homologous end joining protein LigD